MNVYLQKNSKRTFVLQIISYNFEIETRDSAFVYTLGTLHCQKYIYNI